jgi:hypothetical protein
MLKSRIARQYRDLAARYQTKALEAESEKLREDYGRAAKEWQRRASEAEALQSAGL